MLWKFILVNSNDLSHIGELAQARDKKLELVLGKPGSAQFTYPMDAPYAASILPFKAGIKALRWNRLTRVWDCQWSGYVLPNDDAAHENRMTVACIGWLERLRKRFVRREMLFNTLDDGEIVRQLLAELNLTTAPDGYPVVVPTGSNPATPTWMSWGGTQPNEGTGGATAYAATTRNKTVAKYTHILPVIEELQQIENGGDIVVDPLTRAVTWHRRYRRVRDDIVFGFQWGPENARTFNRNIDSDQQINYIVCTGAAGTTPQYAHDVAQQSEIGLLEENVVLSDVKDNNILLTYAGGEQIVRANGKITYSMQPFPTSEGKTSNVPEPLLDYRLGDQIRLTAVHPPRINVRGQAIRIFSISFDISNDGLENLGPLGVAP